MRVRNICKGTHSAFSVVRSPSNIDACRKKSMRQTIVFAIQPHIIGRMAVGGEKEACGPMGKYFQQTIADNKMGEKCFESAEIDLLTCAINGALKSCDLTTNDIDAFVAGDLLNQITTSSYVAREVGLPYLGVYGACSTMTEALAVGSMLINASHFNAVLCATSSHFATAERQFRFPLEYGCQRPAYSQWTVTGGGATILSGNGKGPRVVSATLGKVVDFGTDDLNNMGAAMAPAAMESMLTLFNDTGTSPNDYDMIITGDLGKLGSDILRDIMGERGYTLGQNYIDCGNLIYDNSQDCYQGGSGCACSATVFNSLVLDKLEKGEIKNVAYFATGALMSSQSCYQGETIPCISHGIVVEA